MAISVDAKAKRLRACRLQKRRTPPLSQCLVTRSLLNFLDYSLSSEPSHWHPTPMGQIPLISLKRDREHFMPRHALGWKSFPLGLTPAQPGAITEAEAAPNIQYLVEIASVVVCLVAGGARHPGLEPDHRASADEIRSSNRILDPSPAYTTARPGWCSVCKCSEVCGDIRTKGTAPHPR
jgi:hypothetical protein